MLKNLISSLAKVIPENQVKVTDKATSTTDDFTNIKNQIAKQYFAEFDAQHLKTLTNLLGCKTIDCPQLIDATNIQYNILDTFGRQYIGKGERQNKIIIQSTDTHIINQSPAVQNVTSVGYNLKCIQTYEVIITKTTQIRTEKEVNLILYKKKKVETFTQKEVEKFADVNETTTYFPPQNITVEPFSKMKVSFNFFQYDDIINYFLHFEIAKNSTISHPEIGANSNVIFVKKELGTFLEKHVDFLTTLNYSQENMIKLEAIDEKFILKNFPTTEKITNYGADVVFGRAEKA